MSKKVPPNLIGTGIKEHIQESMKDDNGDDNGNENGYYNGKCSPSDGFDPAYRYKGTLRLNGKDIVAYSVKLSTFKGSGWLIEENPNYEE